MPYIKCTHTLEVCEMPTFNVHVSAGKMVSQNWKCECDIDFSTEIRINTHTRACNRVVRIVVVNVVVDYMILSVITSISFVHKFTHSHWDYDRSSHSSAYSLSRPFFIAFIHAFIFLCFSISNVTSRFSSVARWLNCCNRQIISLSFSFSVERLNAKRQWDWLHNMQIISIYSFNLYPFMFDTESSMELIFMIMYATRRASYIVYDFTRSRCHSTGGAKGFR